jgi:hypothetical protein
MRTEAYIRVVSDESTVMSIHREANILGAQVIRSKAKRAESTDDVWWNWATPRVPIGEHQEDVVLRELLETSKPIFPIINKYRSNGMDVYLEVITKYGQDEDPRGLYLSEDTIRLLAELGAALDHDVYR